MQNSDLHIKMLYGVNRPKLTDATSGKGSWEFYSQKNSLQNETDFFKIR